ncbi:MAG TPA: J domain-containing protein [Tepidisphaeraceae bacterium]|nr:J domain-containing protein [Tepidisphaeraceae bacterium]
MAKKDFYDILGVKPSATTDEIRTAYRKLARKYHPDATKNDPKSTERFKEVQEAYDVLSDDTKRKNYDQFGNAAGPAGFGGAGAGAAGADPFEAFRRSAGNGGSRTWQGGPGVSVEDLDLEGGGLGGIFDQLFGRGRTAGGGASRARQREAPRGADIEHPVTLTFEQAARGTHLPLQINRDGKLETIDLKIPPGVKDGSRVRIKGRGQQTFGGESGDLFIITSVQPHPYFRREGLDVYLDLPISLYESAFGAKVEVPTLDGKVTLTVPPGTSGGAKLRIKGKGIIRGSEQGDQFAVIKVIVPKDLDESDRQLIRKLQDKHPINARADVPWA